MTEITIPELLEMCVEAADKAGDKWCAEHTQPMYVVKDHFTQNVVGTMLDVCGFSYIYTKLRKNSKIFKELERLGVTGCSKNIRIRHKYYMRQELGLLDACNYAAVAVLKKYGIDCYVESRVD